MANPVIKVKRSSVVGKVPIPSQLERGELAVNSYDGKVYIVKDQFSVGIATTTTTVNPWLETGVGVGLSYSGDIKVSGISTFGSDKVVVGAAQTQFLVRGNGRVVGVLTVGSGSVTLNDDSVNVGAGTTILTTGFQIGGNGVFVHSTGYNVGGTFLHNAGITGAGANLSGIVTAVGLDISGNIDIDGTTNLDAVDIDGAVDMASTLTLAGNADFNGNLDVAGDSTLTGNVNISDNKKILFGASDDLEIFHQTSNGNSIIKETGGGILSLQTNGSEVSFYDITNSVIMAQFQTGGACIFRHGATVRLQTASAGITVTGNSAISGNVTAVDATFSGDLDVDGHTELDGVNVSGVSTSIIHRATGGTFRGTQDTVTDAGLVIDDGDTIYLHMSGYMRKLIGHDTSDNSIQIGQFNTGLIDDIHLKPGTNGHIILHDGSTDSNGNTKLATTSTGVNVTGALGVSGNTTFTGKVFANHGVQGNINSSGISTISGFTFPSTDGSEDQALVTDGSGSLSFKTLSGGGGGATGAATTISTGVTTATQGQTAFTAPNVFDDGSQATAFSTQIYLNGIKQRLGASNDYQLSAPQTVNFNSGVTAGDDVSIVVYFGHTLEEEFFTATQGQKDFTLAGNLAASKNYKIFLNGVRLRNTVDYSASAAVVLTQSTNAGDQIDICSDQAEDRLTAVQNQTSFAPSDSNTTSDNMQVYLNGVLLRQTEDWSIGSPAVTILDADGLTAGDHVDVVVRRS